MSQLPPLKVYSKKSQCKGKFKFLGRDVADKVRRKSKARDQLEIYQCIHCAWWHIGKRVTND